MLLSLLLNKIPVIQVVGSPETIEIERISIDSRDAIKKSIFVAIKGFKLDGHKFIPQAISNGASAVVLENDDNQFDQLLKKNNVVKILVNNSKKTLAQISNTFYNTPSAKLNLIGITGTKGKTTTSYFIKNILESAGRKTGLIGTNKNMIGSKEISTKLTTPESHVINYLLNEMVSENCSDCVMEVSSHSLELSRVDELDFNIGVFTNITSDHLDFHSSFENYLEAKKILFDNLKENAKVVFNYDDQNWKYLLSNCSAEKLGYSVNHETDLSIKNVEYSLDGTKYILKYNDQNYEVNTNLIGLFNAYNSAAAIGAALVSGVKIKDAIEGVRLTPQVPGRFEVLNSTNKKVIVDYSHTADSLNQALKAIKHIVKDERPIYTVFGCGGDRDKTKRPIMGKIAEELSDFVYVTSDNPRTEDPFQIIQEIENGMLEKNHSVIEDREKAIQKAIKDSEENAVILIAGKGHENYQEINGVRNYFSDKETAEKFL
ncbi:MAG: UDP-N-acetylmuramoyl-L-alanyl-D-glutamate--2,6-diaminopimelate ligase [Ignavibacteriales bacterium]|nr:UDP-N-acetylmuramoyl-L-alanyl-D-glutamate--2,6-diaminopimelate ligase [Ignavibacteriales bacterium]